MNRFYVVCEGKLSQLKEGISRKKENRQRLKLSWYKHFRVRIYPYQDTWAGTILPSILKCQTLGPKAW